MPPVGFEPTISVGERPQTYALDRAATGTGIIITLAYRLYSFLLQLKKFSRWESNIKMDFQNIGWGGENWIDLLGIGAGGRLF